VVKKEYSYTSTHPLWAVRPVQSLSACTRVHCTLSCLTLRFRVTSIANGIIHCQLTCTQASRLPKNDKHDSPYDFQCRSHCRVYP